MQRNEGEQFDLSLIIINWNTSGLLKRCLESVPSGATDLKCEIIVVDNGSSDDSMRMVESIFPEVRIISNSKNLGFSKAANQGIRASSGKFLALLNSDIEVPTGALSEILKYILKKESVAAASPQIVGLAGKPQYCGGYAPSPKNVLKQLTYLPFSKNRTRGIGIYSKYSNRAISVDWLMAALIVIRRQAIKEAGALDESFFLYGEDMEFGLRLRHHGWQLHLLPWIRALHYGGASSAKLQETNIMWLCGVFRIAACRLGRFSYLLFSLLLAFDFSMKFLVASIAGFYPGNKTGDYPGSRNLKIYAKTALKFALNKPQFAELFYKKNEKRLKEALCDIRQR